MTDILSKLAALTANDEASPVPACPFCGSLKGSLKHDDGTHWWHCDRCGATGPLGSRYSDPENGDALWETRPREQALIALVQEAAGEIERLRDFGLNEVRRANRVIQSLEGEGMTAHCRTVVDNVQKRLLAQEEHLRKVQAVNLHEAVP